MEVKHERGVVVAFYPGSDSGVLGVYDDRLMLTDEEILFHLGDGTMIKIIDDDAVFGEPFGDDQSPDASLLRCPRVGELVVFERTEQDGENVKARPWTYGFLYDNFTGDMRPPSGVSKRQPA
ncbi:hypothetical protein HYX70_02285 [Candidatus Saccharibacteria bacterium]|nr:hypothetical protein [Candidatus Saccharibacteria bacterium]